MIGGSWSFDFCVRTLIKGDMTMSSSTIETRRWRLAGSDSHSWQLALMKSIRRPFEWITSKRRIRRDIDLLLRLDDRMLADIGLSRSDVEYTIRHGRPLNRANDWLDG